MHGSRVVVGASFFTGSKTCNRKAFQVSTRCMFFLPFSHICRQASKDASDTVTVSLINLGCYLQGYTHNAV